MSRSGSTATPAPVERPAWLSAVLAVGGGLLWARCFASEPPPLLAGVALVPLTLLSFGRWAGRWGWLHGFVAWTAAIPWIVPTLQTFGGLPTPLAWLLLGLLAAYLGAFEGLWAGAAARWAPSGSVLLAIGVRVALWIWLEITRGLLFGGFPWNVAATAWTDVVGALPLAAWIGAVGVSGLVVAVPVALGEAWRRRSPELAVAAPMAAAVLLLVAARWAGPAPRATDGLELSVVQPDHEIVTDDAARVWQQYRDLVASSREECEAEGPRLLVWPESAAWPHSWSSSPRLREDVGALAAAGCPVMLNSSLHEGEKVFNAALLVDGEGLAGRYDKRRLVPWGEHVPLARLFPFVGRLARAAGDFTPGTADALLDLGGERIGMAICYEVVYAGGVRSQVAAGATILATITNDAWYGDSAAPRQHFRAARFRAAETGRPLVRAALTGISALVGPRGEVVARLGVGERGILRGRVRGREGDTGWTATWPLVPALALGLLASAILRRSRAVSENSERPGASPGNEGTAG